MNITTQLIFSSSTILLTWWIVAMYYKKKFFHIKSDLIKHVNKTLDDSSREKLKKMTDDIQYYKKYNDKIHKETSEKISKSIEGIDEKVKSLFEKEKEDINKLISDEELTEKSSKILEELLKCDLQKEELVNYVKTLLTKEEIDESFEKLLKEILEENIKELIKKELFSHEEDVYKIAHIDTSLYNNADAYHLKREYDNEVKIVFLPKQFTKTFEIDQTVLYSNLKKHIPSTFNKKEM